MYHTWVLPWPPPGGNVNHQYRPAGGGRRILSPSAVAYRDAVMALVIAAGWRPPAGPLGLSLELYPPDKRRRDLDGPGKLTQDAIFDALGEDDARIVHLEVWKHLPCKENPRIEARLSAVMGFENDNLKESA